MSKFPIDKEKYEKIKIEIEDLHVKKKKIIQFLSFKLFIKKIALETSLRFESMVFIFLSVIQPMFCQRNC